MPISNFLIPLFVKLTHHYGDKWGVLHSHEGLPYQIKGDLDVVVWETKFSTIKLLLQNVAEETGFTLCQLLWYDVDRSTTFIFVGSCGAVVNLDILLDTYGNSRYGFNSKELADNTVELNGIRILTERKMHEYRIVKSISKARNLRLDQEINEYRSFLKEMFDSSSCVKETNMRIEVELSNLKSVALQLPRKKYSNIHYYLSEARRFVHRVCYPTGLVIVFNQSWKKELVHLRDEFFINQSFRKEENANGMNLKCFLFLLYSGLYTMPNRLLPKGWVIFYSGWFRMKIVRLKSTQELKSSIKNFLLTRRLLK